MTDKRFYEIRNEIERRTNILIHNKGVDFHLNSLILFHINLSMLGNPFHKEEWMINFDKFITDDEYDSLEYDFITLKCYNLLIELSLSINN
jgi:hypothetical protein